MTEAEARDGARITQPITPAAQVGVVKEQQHIVQRLVHRTVARRAPPMRCLMGTSGSVSQVATLLWQPDLYRNH